MATHSSIQPEESQWTEEPGGLQSIRPQRAGHDGSDLARVHVYFEPSYLFVLPSVCLPWIWLFLLMILLIWVEIFNSHRWWQLWSCSVCGLWGQATWVQTPIPPFISHVNLGE